MLSYTEPYEGIDWHFRSPYKEMYSNLEAIDKYLFDVWFDSRWPFEQNFLKTLKAARTEYKKELKTANKSLAKLRLEIKLHYIRQDREMWKKHEWKTYKRLKRKFETRNKK